MINKKIIFVITFLSVCIVPILFLNRQEDFLSDIDNRYLTNNSDINSFNDLGDYIDDRVGGRRKMIEFYHAFNKMMFNSYEHNEIVVGKNNHLFPKIEDNVIYNDYHDDFANFIIDMNKYYCDRGIDFYFVFNPSKTSILSEYLPEGINYNNNWVEKFLNKLINEDVNVIDNYELFSECEDKEFLYNKEYDSAHWNDYGALFGTNNLFKKMNETYKNIELLEIEKNFYYDYILTDYLPNTAIKCDEQVMVLKPKFEYTDSTNDYIDGLELQDEFNYFHYYTSYDSSKPRVLMFQGSYYDSNQRSKFIIPNTSDYIAVHNYRNVEQYDYYTNIFQPDCVIFEVAEYTFKEYYFSQWAMQNKKTTDAFVFSSEITESDIKVEISIQNTGGYNYVDINNLPKDLESCYLLYGEEKVVDLQYQEQGRYDCMIDSVFDILDRTKVVYKKDGQYYSPSIVINVFD